MVKLAFIAMTETKPKPAEKFEASETMNNTNFLSFFFEKSILKTWKKLLDIATKTGLDSLKTASK